VETIDIELSLVKDPVPKQSARFTKTGFAYQPHRIRHYQDMLIRQITSKVSKLAVTTPIDGPLSVELMFYFKLPKSKRITQRHVSRPDVDNLAKPVLDSMQKGGLIYNDSQICELKLSKYYSNSEPCIFIRLWSING